MSKHEGIATFQRHAERQEKKAAKARKKLEKRQAKRGGRLEIKSELR